ncbi:MAG TPA: PIN domain-containing protein [Acidimicrobiia bacterium]|nr:PIN domain-containing protein [Acidimicrobiia bacterium]
MTVLADTSVWVDYLRNGPEGGAGALDGFLAGRDVVVCGPVVAELLAGTAPRHRDELWRLFAGVPWADLERPQWHRVGEVAALLRGRGETVALTDIEIAVAAEHAGAALWSDDTDFERIEGVMDSLERFAPR